MMNKKLLASAILSVLSFGTMADTPSFDKIEVGFSSFDFDLGVGDIDGFELKGSKEINDNFYVAGDYSKLSENGYSYSLTTVGVGYKNDISTSSTFFAELDYAKIDADGGVDADGYELTSGIRSMLTNKVELMAAIEYADIDGNDTTSLVLGSAYNLTDNFALYADYKYESELSRYGVGVRFNF
jgi:hypothetical protein